MSNAIGQVAGALEEAETPLSEVAERLPKTVSKKSCPRGSKLEHAMIYV